MQLREGKDYNITVNGITYTFNFINDNDGCFLYFPDYFNDILFDAYFIDRNKLVKRTIGYDNGGVWPFCKTQEDCESILYALINEIKQKATCVCDFKLLNETKYWYD